MQRPRPQTSKPTYKQPSNDTFPFASVLGFSYLEKVVEQERRKEEQVKKERKPIRPATARVDSKPRPNPTPISPQDVVIHVFDEQRNVKRDFYCKKQMLISQMRYFDTVLQEDSNSLFYDIDVHSDIQVFEWLMDFCLKQEIKLENHTVISILISSNFLQMAQLEEMCLRYTYENINSIITVPIDFSCINSQILAKLVYYFTPNDIAEIVDPKDKIKSQLYFNKLLEIVQDGEKPKIFGCQKCNKVFSNKKMACERQTPTIDKFGNISRHHTVDETFDINEWIVAIFQSCSDWETCFWRVWGHLHYLECIECKQQFACSDYYNCCKHPLPTTASDNGICRQCERLIAPFSPFELAFVSVC
ncbi:hypothetical protein HDV04_005393 [Boothiomyces sp. JEL0838]|nr:hypothetical protein HDV04_005393 [Boothiomyces sp. JEL0838]